MTHVKIIASRIRGLEFDLERLREEHISILSMPDRNLNGFACPRKKSALNRVQRKIRLHEASIDLNYKMMKEAYNA